MQPDLWHLDDFKGSDTLLLSGQANAINALAHALEAFAASDAIAMELEDRLPVVGSGHLFVLKEVAQVTGQFRWLVPASSLPGIVAQIRAVAAGAPAHQCFYLIEVGTTFLVSAGEYSSEFFGHWPNNSSKPTSLCGKA